MKRERLEDLGRIYEHLENLLTDDFWTMFESKHSYEKFDEYLQDHSDVVFSEIRSIKYRLDLMMSIVHGNGEDD